MSFNNYTILKNENDIENKPIKIGCFKELDQDTVLSTITVNKNSKEIQVSFLLYILTLKDGQEYCLVDGLKGSKIVVVKHRSTSYDFSKHNYNLINDLLINIIKVYDGKWNRVFIKQLLKGYLNIIVLKPMNHSISKKKTDSNQEEVDIKKSARSLAIRILNRIKN